MKFHEYTKRRPTKNVQSLLDYIGSHQDPIFWAESSHGRVGTHRYGREYERRAMG